MSLDDLQATIEKMQDKIEVHLLYLSGNETATRQVLIDPMLLELGWNVSDPNQVALEYSAGGGRADYALKSNDAPVAVIEAKRLGNQLEEREIMQVLNYANSRGIAYMVVTNGDDWRMYDVFARQPIEERILMQFSITQTPAHESALQALRMWRSNLASPRNPIPARDPVLQSEKNKEEYDDAVTSNPPVFLPEPDEQEGLKTLQTTTEPDTEPEWVVLTDLLSLDRKSQKPRRIKFPQGQPKSFRASGVGVLREIAEWLVNSEKLTLKNAQVPHPKIKNRYVASSRKQDLQKPEEICVGVYIEKNWNAQDSVDGAKGVLEHCGVDPSTIQVSFDRV